MVQVRACSHILVGTNACLRISSGLPLDLLRCESLLGLDPATCSRVLNKNYKLLVSMAPLSNEIRPISSCTPQVAPAHPGDCSQTRREGCAITGTYKTVLSEHSDPTQIPVLLRVWFKLNRSFFASGFLYKSCTLYKTLPTDYMSTFP